jgi:6-phosphogluconolactonase
MTRIVFAGAMAALACVCSCGGGRDDPGTVATSSASLIGGRGRVFTLTNDASQNAVVEFERAADGSLTLLATAPTGGTGSGAGLGSQGSVIVTRDRRWVLAVNAGSNDISVLKISHSGLVLSDAKPSGGDSPISVTEHHGLVYVLNAGARQSISGFRLSAFGLLDPIPDSVRGLSSASSVGAAQIQFTPDGAHLIVTEKATNQIDVFEVGPDGVGDAIVTRSAGDTPFGFDIDAHGTIVVSDAFGGMAGAGAMSSYRLDASGVPQAVSGPVQDHQSAPCWVAIVESGRYAFTTNTRTSNISAYALAPQGAITLIASPEGTTATGAGPIDMALSDASRFLYVLEAGAHAVEVFRVDRASGALVATPGGANNLPAHAVGLAAF